MVRSISAGALLCALPILSLTGVYDVPQRRDTNVTTNIRSDQNVTSCDQIDVKFQGAQTYRAEERRVIARSAVRTLTVQGARNAGVWVTGGSGDEYAITICKAAADWADGGTLNDMSLSVNNDRVSVTGPAHEGWVAHLLISAPREGALDLTTLNGPIGVRLVSGSVAAHTTNGPISLRDSAGTFALEAQNGPISIGGASGSVRARTQNGPISVKLDGASWSGGGLDARAENGPLSIDVPDTYQSGVQVDLSTHSPFSCKGAVCGQTNRNWDDQARSVRFGGSPVTVRLATVNGPVSINSRP